ncbi:MAG: tRNA (adenosine(37)-N6)-dimethylallyltransferase MiaA [Patescibacteria group bacterium]
MRKKSLQKSAPQKPKLLVILGPTASGKSDLAILLAKKFDGEVVSADSRQVYKGLDIGTGKITKREMRGIPHHLLDVAHPRNIFTVTKWQRLAEKAIADIVRRGKLPIVVGGTGFYIQAIVDDINVPEVKPNKALRAQLEQKTAALLFTMLKKLDPRRAKEIDAKNPRRLIRAIEIAKQLGSVPDLKKEGSKKYEILQIGIATDDKVLKEKIRKRLVTRIKTGMVAEAGRVHKEGLSWKRMEELGLEYRSLARYLQGKITKRQMTEELAQAIWRYAKRQRTWFKKDKRIQWFPLQQKKNIETVVGKFLS